MTRLDALAFGGCTTTPSGAPPTTPTPTATPTPTTTTTTPAAVKDLTRPLLSLLSKSRQNVADLRGGGLKFTLKVNEPAKLDVSLLGRLTYSGARGKSRRLARISVNSASAGQLTVTLRPSSALRAQLRKEKRVPALLQVKATDAAGNVTTRTKALTFR